MMKNNKVFLVLNLSGVIALSNVVMAMDYSLEFNYPSQEYERQIGKLSTKIEEGDLEAVKQIMEKTGHNFLHPFGNSAMHYAASFNQVEIAKYLGKININKKNLFGETPLHHAVLTGHFEMVKYLVENGADIQSRAGDGTSLDYAMSRGYPEILKYLMFHASQNNIVLENSTLEKHESSLLQKRRRRR